MVGLYSLESCCGRPKMRKFSFRRIKREGVGRHPVRYASYSVFKVLREGESYERNSKLRMIREVEYHQHRGDGLLLN